MADFHGERIDPSLIRQLIHDLRTPLSVVCMGLEALQHVREDERQFNDLVNMMASEGTERMKDLLDVMAAEVSAKSTARDATDTDRFAE